MKKPISFVCLASVLMTGLAIMARGADATPPAANDPIDFVFGVGLVISPGYNDVLTRSYKNYSTSGGYGWLDLQAGVRLKANPYLSITPGVDWMVNFVAGDVSFMNSIVLPTLSGRLTFMEGASLYIEGEINYGYPSTGSDRFTVESGGVGFGGSVGFAFDAKSSIDLGYRYLPVKVGRATEDFGGVVLRVQFGI